MQVFPRHRLVAFAGCALSTCFHTVSLKADIKTLQGVMLDQRLIVYHKLSYDSVLWIHARERLQLYPTGSGRWRNVDLVTDALVHLFPIAVPSHGDIGRRSFLGQIGIRRHLCLLDLRKILTVIQSSGCKRI
jgi:hypothetical protein